MKLERIGTNNVVVPENKLDRQILQLLLVHMKPDNAGYWDVHSNDYDPMGHDDWQGRIYVSWEGPDRVRTLNAFSICRDDSGFLSVLKM